MDPRFEKLKKTTLYFYANKPMIEQMHDAGDISDETYNEIKTNINTLLQGENFNYDNMPDVYEGYSIEGLGGWKYTTPPSQ